MLIISQFTEDVNMDKLRFFVVSIIFNIINKKGQFLLSFFYYIANCALFFRQTLSASFIRLSASYLSRLPPIPK